MYDGRARKVSEEGEVVVCAEDVRVYGVEAAWVACQRTYLRKGSVYVP